MRPVLSYVCLSMLLIPGIALAGANPVVDALAAGTVVQFSGRKPCPRRTSSMSRWQPATRISTWPGAGAAHRIRRRRRASDRRNDRADRADRRGGGAGLIWLRIVSSMNRLKYRSANRTFYSKKSARSFTGPKDAGISNVEFRLAGSTEAEEMTMQYQETDFAFVSRLMESAGIHYHVEPTPAGDKRS